MKGDVLQPSADSGATRLAIAYDIAWGCKRVKGDPKQVAALVGELVRIMLERESGGQG